MTDFAIDAAPLAPPTRCVFCRDHRDPLGFAHRGIENDIAHFGRPYVCGSCGVALGKAFGMIPRELYDATRATIAERDQQIASLEQALAEEKLNKVVPLAEVVDFTQKYFEKHGVKPKAGSAA